MSGDKTKSQCVTYATIEGLKAVAVTTLFTTAGVLGASKYSPTFNKRLGPSGKAIVICVTGFAVFFPFSEWAMSDCSRRARWRELGADEHQSRLEHGAGDKSMERTL